MLKHRGARDGGRQLPQRRSEGERQPARFEVHEIDQGAAAVRRFDPEAQSGEGIGLLRGQLPDPARKRNMVAFAWALWGARHAAARSKGAVSIPLKSSATAASTVSWQPAR